MKRNLLLLLFISFTCNCLNAQFSRYIIKFKNKATNPYSISSPSTYLSAKAIARRTAYGIAIDSTDLPVTARYVDSVRLAGTVTILNVSKWLNQVSIQTTDAAALNKINNLTFVQTVTGIAARVNNGNNENPKTKDKFELERELIDAPLQRNTNTSSDFFSYGNTYDEIHLHNGEFLHNIGMRGQNMLVAVLDAGFFHYNTLKAFDSVVANNQVVQTWDFVARESSVTEDDSHGMSCFSAIGGNIPGSFVGNAPKANFVLYRTEDVSSEYPIEEHNWACGAERADSIGADIISTSLGYTTFDNPSLDHTYASMNGKTNISTKAAVIANRKGLLSFVAAGNDGGNSWHYLSSPGDADSLVTVGAVSNAGVVGGFSSYGPSSDGRIKPEVAGVGVGAYVQNPNNTIGAGNGTSYATPKMAGLGTCLWQAFPEFNNMAIRDALMKSSSIYTAPNDRIGYGVPDMKKAFIVLLNKFAKINSASVANCKAIIAWKTKDVSSMKFEIERLAPGQISYTKIAEVQGQGSILGIHNYSYDDALSSMPAGTIKYRIKQVIDTSIAGYAATYFDSASVILSTACTAVAVTDDKVSIMPNPVSGQFVLRVETNYAVTNLNIRITDMKGSLMQQQTKSKGIGRADFPMSSNYFARGEYTISVYNADVLIGNTRLVKL
jgi:serine protease AprX